MPAISFSGMLIIALVAVAVPVALALVPRLPVPGAVLEVIAGFLIGPEGGFAAAELDALRKLPFVVAIGLGPRLLRAETAAVAALACWQALAGDGATAESRPPFRNEFVS